ncbi:MAG: hypothetical protein VKJ04_06945 [Vampirovibrionales bacterium]|nr:hypothetical protein [Vampirovibrionales bacterium]
MSEQTRKFQNTPSDKAPRTFLDKLKLGLLWHARSGPETKRPEDAVLEDLLRVNQAIEEQYHALRRQKMSSADEAACVDAIKQLEMVRLNLLTRLNGQKLEGYAKRPLQMN